MPYYTHPTTRMTPLLLCLTLLDQIRVDILLQFPRGPIYIRPFRQLLYLDHLSNVPGSLPHHSLSHSVFKPIVKSPSRLEVFRLDIGNGKFVSSTPERKRCSSLSLISSSTSLRKLSSENTVSGSFVTSCAP